jgi:hypothetical protein
MNRKPSLLVIFLSVFIDLIGLNIVLPPLRLANLRFIELTLSRNIFA